MTEQVQFEKGDMLRCVDDKGHQPNLLVGREYVVENIGDDGQVYVGLKYDGFYPCRFELVRRASESQREGGVACAACGEPASPRPCTVVTVETCYLCERCWCRSPDENRKAIALRAPAQPDSYAERVRNFPHEPPPPMVPPQPAPMTRAARVLSGMMADPYKEIVKGPPAAEANRRQEAARLRMAKWSLDRPLDAERARWERLVGPVHPVTGRAVRR